MSVHQERNRDMAEKIYQHTQEEGVHLVAVGLSHLLNPGNILERLEEKGCEAYEVDLTMSSAI